MYASLVKWEKGVRLRKLLLSGKANGTNSERVNIYSFGVTPIVLTVRGMRSKKVT